MACGSSLLRINPGPLHWKLRFLATGAPGKIALMIPLKYEVIYLFILFLFTKNVKSMFLSSSRERHLESFH